MKVCSKCKTTKEVSQFYKSKDRPDGLCLQCKTCMQANAKKRRASGQESLVQQLWRQQARLTPAYRAGRLVAGAKQRTTCTLTMEWVRDKIAAGYCEVTGIPFDLEGHGAPARSFSPSLDRINPDEGYTPENTQVVAWIYNRAKGVQDHQDVLTLARALCRN